MLGRLGNVIYWAACIISLLLLYCIGYGYFHDPDISYYYSYHTQGQTLADYTLEKRQSQFGEMKLYGLGAAASLAIGKAIQYILGGKWSLKEYWDEHY